MMMTVFAAVIGIVVEVVVGSVAVVVAGGVE